MMVAMVGLYSCAVAVTEDWGRKENSEGPRRRRRRRRREGRERRKKRKGNTDGNLLCCILH